MANVISFSEENKTSTSDFSCWKIDISKYSDFWEEKKSNVNEIFNPKNYVSV